MSNGFPIVNFNGATRDALIDARSNARDALYKAMEALESCRPHMRDYQTAPNAQSEYTTALQRYSTQFAALDRISNELYAEMEFIAAQE